VLGIVCVGQVQLLVVGVTKELFVHCTVVIHLQDAVAGEAAKAVFVERLLRKKEKITAKFIILKGLFRKQTLSLAPTNSIGYTVLVQMWHFWLACCRLGPANERADAGATLRSALRRREISTPGFFLWGKNPTQKDEKVAFYALACQMETDQSVFPLVKQRPRCCRGLATTGRARSSRHRTFSPSCTFPQAPRRYCPSPQTARQT
jgi:hypothetical protein